MLSNKERDTIEAACEAAKQLLRIAVEPIAEKHPELSFYIEPRVEVDLQDSPPTEVVA